MQIQQISHNQILPLIAAAKRDGVTIRESDTIFAAREDCGIVAIGCVRFVGKRRARLCGAWTVPKMRGNGYGRALVEHRLQFVDNIPSHQYSIRVIDTFAFNTKLYTALGFESLRSFKIGTTHLVRLCHQ
jgi:predicted GNAT family acetyltransferase